MLAWKVRAALRAARGPQWPGVLQAINAMSEEARAEPAWVYWKARALLAKGGDDAPRRGPAAAASRSPRSRGFYEQLALEELGQQDHASRRARAADAPKKRKRRALNPSLNRALYAIALGIRPEGVREWNYGTNMAKPGGMDERELLAAAQLACEREVWDRCINTSERTKAEFDVEQRFPMPFRESVVRRSREISLDPAYVYGLIRQESRFIMDARSHVGASGLMQVMPATARWTARKIGLANFTPDQLHDRETNIAIGTGYLKLVLDDFDGSMPLAAAAYNAGPGRPRGWRNGPVMEAAAWAENVPFAETRDYVKKVLANTTIYAAILTGQPQSLKARLGRVGPRDAAQPEPYRRPALRPSRRDAAVDRRSVCINRRLGPQHRGTPPGDTHAQALHRQQELLVLVDAAWVLLKQAGIPFEEVKVRFDSFEPGSTFKQDAAVGQPGRPGAGAGRRRLRGLGHAGHRRIPGREVSRTGRCGPRTRRPGPAPAASAPRCIRASPRCAATAR